MTTNPWLAAQAIAAPDSPAETPTLWVYGVHGGAGESRIAALSPDWHATQHAWPDQDGATVLLVARTSAAGLHAAHSTIADWAAGRAPHPVSITGLVLIADAPGRLPRPLNDLAKHVIGGVQRSWRIGWCEPWRLGDFDATAPGAERLVKDLS